MIVNLSGVKFQHNFNIFTLHQHHRTLNDHLREHSARNRKLARNRKSHLKNIVGEACVVNRFNLSFFITSKIPHLN